MSQISVTGAQGYTWDRNAITILITAYETNPNLYQTNHPDYKLKNKRADALNNIKETLFENGFEVSIEERNKKIHNLRTQFFKEYGKVKKQILSGAGTADLYVPKIWWYDILQFLIHSDPVRDSQSNIEIQPGSSNQRIDQAVNEGTHSQTCTQDTDTEDHIIYDGVVEDMENVYLPKIQSKKPKKKAMTNAVEEDTKTLLKSATNVLNVISANRKPDSENEMKPFGSMVAEELKKIGDEEEIRLAKKQILNCVLDAQERAARKRNI